MGGKQSTAISDIKMSRIRSTRWATDDDNAEDLSPLLDERALDAISRMAEDGAKHQSLSFDSFHRAASVFLEANSDALNKIDNLKDEISSNPDLVDFVTKHLNNNIKTLHFLDAIKNSIQKALEAERLLHHAVVHFDHGNHVAAFEKLRQFKEEGNLFTEEFIKEFKGVIERDNSILEDLCRRKDELTPKLDNVKLWRRIWKIVYYAALATVLISAFVLAALAAPVTLIVPFTVAASAMPPLKELVDWVLDKFQSPQEREGEIISSLKEETHFAIHELNNIKACVEELKINKIEPIVNSAEFAIEEREIEALRMAMVDIKLMAQTFAESVKKLKKEVDRHDKKLKKKTVTILKKFPDSLKKKKTLGISKKPIEKKKPISPKMLGKKSPKRKLKDV